MESYINLTSFGYLIISTGLLYMSYKYISGGISVVYSLYKYQLDKQYEAVRITKRLLLVPYTYQHQKYYALLPIKSHKSYTVLNVYTKTHYFLDEKLIEYEQDVTSDLNRYLGHNGDFSGCTVTPSMLGFRELIFKIMDTNGDIRTLTFGENKVIVFDKE